MLAGCIDEQVLDIAIRPHRHDGGAALVDCDRSHRPHRAFKDTGLHRLSANAAALNPIQTDLDGLAVDRFVAFIDRDVIHPHGVLLGHRRGVRQTHRIAIEENLALALRGFGRTRQQNWVETRFSAIKDGQIRVALHVVFWRCRPKRRTGGIAIIEDRSFGRGGLRGDAERGHRGGIAVAVTVAGCGNGGDAQRDNKCSASLLHGCLDLFKTSFKTGVRAAAGAAAAHVALSKRFT